MIPKATFLGAVGAFALTASAHGQVVIQPAPQQPPVIERPVIEPPAAQPVVIESPPSNVVVISPDTATTHVSVPQGVVTTTTPLTAPFNPAPPNTVIETTAGRRIVQAVDGWDVLFDDNGTTRRAHALLTDGLADHNSIAVRTAAERMWPLTVGASQTTDTGTSTAHAVTYRVLRTETITVPAGTFFTYVVQRIDHAPIDGTDVYKTMWYAPSVGAMVKSEEARTQPGVGDPSYQVVSMTLPHPVATGAVATVARRPDTLESRAEYCRQRGTTVRLADGRAAALDCPTYIQTDRVGYDDWLIVR